MQLKTIFGLAAITLPVTAAAIFWPAPDGAAISQAAGGPLLPGLKSGWADIATLTVTGPAGAVTVRHAKPGAKPQDGWVVADKANYPVQPDTIKPVLENLRALHGVAAKTARPALYGRLDLDDPGKSAGAHRVTLLDAKGVALANVVLGRQKSDSTPGSGEQQYARVVGDAQTWLAAPAVTLPDSTLAWVDHSIIDLDGSKVKSVVITQADGSSLTYGRAKPEDTLALQTPLPAGRKLKSDDHGSEIAGGLATLELTDVKPAAQVSGTKLASAHYERFDGLTADVSLRQQDGTAWAVVSVTAPAGAKEAAKDAAEISARTQGWAYGLSEPRAQTLETKLEDLLEAPPKVEAKPEAAKATGGTKGR